ncbi:shikimate dehydrogenase [Microbacterium testaceum]|uniref:shikimate dehydrogenase family protein n=1 Tax=Microbacterium TaxID=33882 RepID=UPI002780F3E9|nr:MULTISPECIES: shikimate dehydrogenase [Microbacterium]MDQ1113685.1 shikimate dehydrogenase [Microbacterium testaceum]MDR6099214.1 shikimate dehydrogenase [Microbacterium sp. SORGH_AS_0454]
MLTGPRRRLAVWGDPIAHSRSPRLHAAAYGTLGLDWDYGRRRVGEANFAAAVEELDAAWRGLSLTMPLKHAAARAAVSLDDDARLTGAVNTFLLAEGGPRGFNTDVGGLARALDEIGVREPGAIRVLGAGATATSAVVAAARTGAGLIEVRARRPEAAAPLGALADPLGVVVRVVALDDPELSPVDATIAALPGGTDLGRVADDLASVSGPLVDVVYGGWPAPLAQAWERAGGEAHDGLAMLLHQALLQVRVFVGADPEVALERETEVLAAMRTALVGD